MLQLEEVLQMEDALLPMQGSPPLEASRKHDEPLQWNSGAILQITRSKLFVNALLLLTMILLPATVAIHRDQLQRFTIQPIDANQHQSTPVKPSALDRITYASMDGHYYIDEVEGYYSLCGGFYPEIQDLFDSEGWDETLWDDCLELEQKITYLISRWDFQEAVGTGVADPLGKTTSNHSPCTPLF